MLTGGRPLRLRALRPLCRFGKSERGIAAVEFALVLPVVLLVLLCCFEVPRYVLIYQKVARTASGVADLVSQADEPMTATQLTDVYSAAGAMMDPYDLKTNGKIYITSINNPTGAGASITWQRNSGSLGGVSTKITSVASLPAGLSPPAGESVLIAEVYYHYAPIFTSLIYNGTNFYRVSYIRPRNDNLMTGP
jgi:Flp pilus assembly protein TadG